MPPGNTAAPTVVERAVDPCGQPLSTGVDGSAGRTGPSSHERTPRPHRSPQHVLVRQPAARQHHRLPDEPRVTLRGPAELADALPYMLGFHPTDSVVLLALHGGRGRFGGRIRLGIPRSPEEWGPVAEQLAECLVEGAERRGSRPDGIVVFLCQDPAEGESGRRVMERLRPFAQKLRTACGALDVPVYEALCLSDGRFWSYCCPDSDCCPPDGTALAPPGTSVMAAAAAYAGIHVRGSLRDMEARLRPRTARTTVAEQERALDTASAALVHRILDVKACKDVRDDTIRLARCLVDRLAEHPPLADPDTSDTRDDALITHEEAAELIVGLQDRRTRDRAAEWMEGPVADHALRLWRALARRCVGVYGEHAAAPSPSPDGSRGRPPTSPAPVSPWGWRSTRTPSTSSPGCCTRRATSS